jgi:hypothetical protein
MRKIKILALISVLILGVLLFTGCANKILYGSWQLKETINAETGEAEEPAMFANMMVFKINRDGTVEFLDKTFGTYEKKGSEFTFDYVVDEGEEAKSESGAWELIGTDLYIYDESKPLIYHLVAVTTKDEQ